MTSEQKNEIQISNEKIESPLETTKNISENVSIVGDVIAAVGYVAAPLSGGSTLVLGVIGEAISLTGKLVYHSAEVVENGFNKNNITDFGVDIAIEILPVPLENAIKKSSLDDVSKRILRSEVGMLKQATEIGIKNQIETKRTNDYD